MTSRVWHEQQQHEQESGEPMDVAARQAALQRAMQQRQQQQQQVLLPGQQPPPPLPQQQQEQQQQQQQLAFMQQQQLAFMQQQQQQQLAFMLQQQQQQLWLPGAEPAFGSGAFSFMHLVASAVGSMPMAAAAPYQHPNQLAALMSAAAQLAIQQAVSRGMLVPSSGSGGTGASAGAGGGSAAVGSGDGVAARSKAGSSGQGGTPGSSAAVSVLPKLGELTASALWSFWAKKPLVDGKPPKDLEGSVWRKGVPKQRWSEFSIAISIIERHAAFLTTQQRGRVVSEGDAAESLDRLMLAARPPMTLPRLVQKWWPQQKPKPHEERGTLWQQLFLSDA